MIEELQALQMEHKALSNMFVEAARIGDWMYMLQANAALAQMEMRMQELEDEIVAEEFKDEAVDEMVDYLIEEMKNELD